MHEDEFLPLILAECLTVVAKDFQIKSPTYVDLNDSDAIVTGFSSEKLNRTPPPHILFFPLYSITRV